MPRKYTKRQIANPCFWCGDNLSRRVGEATDRHGNRLHPHCLKIVEQEGFEEHPLYLPSATGTSLLTCLT